MKPLTCADLAGLGIPGFVDHDPMSQSPGDSFMCSCCSRPSLSDCDFCAGEYHYGDEYEGQKCGFEELFVSATYLDEDGAPPRILACCSCWDNWMPKVDGSVSIPALFDRVAEEKGWSLAAEPQVAEARA